MNSESGCIVTVEMKFRFQTDFLDRVFISQGVIQEGESRMDALLRVNREVEETVERLKKEKGLTGQVPHQEAPFGMNMMRETSQVIDYKRMDQLEIDINNATTPEELELIVKYAGAFPAKLLSTINAKRQYFKNMTNGK
jgi:hypothetical protein